MKISRDYLLERLRRGPSVRARFVQSHLEKSIAFQVRAMRGDMSQVEFSKRIGIAQNNFSARLENPYYGKHTLSTLLKVARAKDVGLVAWFVPFSRIVSWVLEEPYLDLGLNSSFYNPAGYEEEFPKLGLE